MRLLGNPGSLQRGRVGRHDNMHERDRAEVGQPPHGWEYVALGIRILMAMVMRTVAPGLEVREKDRETTNKMDSGRLEASEHADTTEEAGTDKCQLLRQQPKPKL